MHRDRFCSRRRFNRARRCRFRWGRRRIAHRFGRNCLTRLNRSRRDRRCCGRGRRNTPRRRLLCECGGGRKKQASGQGEAGDGRSRMMRKHWELLCLIK
ncbi:unnamed protein product [Ciceribacter selenitireducens ATCC BAA-1503]|uniref:Uncharacterized protein n=1 Tax=Ciceribacter selenitireducens ATCC BAA-1503 TaxID=1336235 RepID=A0A376ABH3_9HYPH|nr:unnamed protein product [Ciceribacter selenitireducens ATCC BAA-1503]